jgi:aromatic ring-opening dioxygenase catalytic subunit (LigB family)
VAEIVGAFGTPHMPNSPEAVRQNPQSEVGQLFRAVRSHLEAVDPEVLVVFDTDHFAVFFYDNLPSFCVGIAERTRGPGTDDWPGLPSYDNVPVEEGLGRHLLRYALGQGFDLARTEEFIVDHSIIVPLHFLNPAMQRPMLPVWVNGIAPPFPTARRVYALGRMVRDAVEAWPRTLRVGVICSGALSGDIGGPRARDHQPAAPPDYQWVANVVRRISDGEIEDLLSEATEERILRAGNVTGEMLNWIALLGVVGAHKPRMLEPQTEAGNGYGAWRWD